MEIALHKGIQKRAFQSMLIWGAVKGAGIWVFVFLLQKKQGIFTFPFDLLFLVSMVVWLERILYYLPNMQKHKELCMRLGSPYLAEIAAEMKTKRLHDMLHEHWFIKRYRQQWGS